MNGKIVDFQLTVPTNAHGESERGGGEGKCIKMSHMIQNCRILFIVVVYFSAPAKVHLALSSPETPQLLLLLLSIVD
jgi:hypothetical protein